MRRSLRSHVTARGCRPGVGEKGVLGGDPMGERKPTESRLDPRPWSSVRVWESGKGMA